VPISLFQPDGDFVLSTPVRRLENVAPGSYLLTVDGGDAKAFALQEGGLAVVELP
jgi:hypothetical protein